MHSRQSRYAKIPLTSLVIRATTDRLPLVWESLTYGQIIFRINNYDIILLLSDSDIAGDLIRVLNMVPLSSDQEQRISKSAPVPKASLVSILLSIPVGSQ